jgi:hypothetical protein
VQLRFWWESQKERDHYEDLYVEERVIFKLMLRERGWVWYGLISLRIRTSGGLL